MKELMAVLEDLAREIEERIHLFELLVARLPEEDPAVTDKGKPKRYLTPAARRRIGAAQKKRWQEHRAAAAKAAALEKKTREA